MSEWLQKWLRIYAPIRCSSGVTLEKYQQLGNYLLNGSTSELRSLASTPLKELTHQLIELALMSLLEAPARRRKHLSRRSVRHLGGLLSSALAKASRLDLIPSNPMRKVELPSPEAATARSLTIDEVRRLRLICKGDWTAVFVELALATGCRRGELLALQWSDLNRQTRVLSITKSVEETRKGLRLKLPKSGRGRACTLPQSTLRMLPNQDERGEPRVGLIFPGRDGKWRSPALVSQLIVRRMRRAGIPHASLHSLRHTHASTLLSRGLPLPAVSQRLGHSDPNITLRIYSHALPLDDHRLAEEWDRLIDGLQS